MNRHTPGPWICNGDQDAILAGGQGLAVLLHAHNGGDRDRYGSAEATCDALARSLTQDESKANARLMAAAPDLLELVRRCAPLVRRCADTTVGHDPLVDLDRDICRTLNQLEIP